MGVVHGTDKDLVMKHKEAIDKHLNDIGIEVLYTNVFWEEEVKLNHPRFHQQFTKNGTKKTIQS